MKDFFAMLTTLKQMSLALIAVILFVNPLNASAAPNSSCPSTPQICSSQRNCFDCGLACLGSQCPQAKAQRPECFTCGKAKAVLAAKNCPVVCAPPTPTATPTATPTITPTATPTSDAEGKPDGPIEIDYTACAALPAQGRQGYGKCADNSVVVIINDGQSQAQTCCPLGGKNILSSKESERHVLRTGSCQTDEVLTGMQSASGNRGYCSKINTEYLKLSSPEPSQYVIGNAPGVLGEIARSYRVNDCCICPEGTVALLGHTTTDNKCAEQCVKIEEKK